MKKENVIFLALLVIAFFLIFWNLGERPLFGVEGRWAEAAREMVLRNSWFVPTLNFDPHITKPLIPFWLIKLSGMLFQQFNEFFVRLPGALLAFASLLVFYRGVTHLFSYPWNLIATGLLLTSVGFIEFSRLAQSEIYQLFGIIVGITFYVCFRNQKSFLGYLGFFIGMVLGGLSKGITSFVVLITLPLIDSILEKRFFHLNWKSILAALIALSLYFLPYYLTSQELKSEIPFYLWFRENLKQAVDPYDNLRPFFIYLYFWPLWLAPWSLLLIGALVKFTSNFQKLSTEEKLFFLTSLAIFFIFTIAKARRGYYLLPILPFSIILITYYLKNHCHQFLLKTYQLLKYPLILLPLGAFFILLSLGLKPSLGISLGLILGFLIQGLIFFLLKKENLFSLILHFAVIEWLVYGLLIPYHSKSSEKEAGIFLNTLLSQKQNATVCQLNQPVANVYFYAQINQKVEPFVEGKDCDIILIRKKIPQEITNLTEKGYKLTTFKAQKDPSKTYYILYKPFR